jgi:hypothetical protein
MNRILEAEILDHLDPADPGAVRSRRDLRHLDLFLGNSRWILRSLRRFCDCPDRLVELGAGEGLLCRRVHASRGWRSITGLDLIARPRNLPESIAWVSGDFIHTLPSLEAEVCYGSLILHHLDAAALRLLGAELGRFSRLLFSEPYRGMFPLCMAALASPFVGKVTWHDMPASIRAGFRKRELAGLLGLDPSQWEIREQVTRRGTLRFEAIRR